MWSLQEDYAIGRRQKLAALPDEASRRAFLVRGAFDMFDRSSGGILREYVLLPLRVLWKSRRARAHREDIEFMFVVLRVSADTKEVAATRAALAAARQSTLLLAPEERSMYCAFNVAAEEQPFADPDTRKMLRKRVKKRARLAARARYKGLPVPPEAITPGPVDNDPMRATISPPSGIDYDTVLSWYVGGAGRCTAGLTAQCAQAEDNPEGACVCAGAY